MQSHSHFQFLPKANDQPYSDVYKLVLRQSSAQSGTFAYSTYAVNLPITHDVKNCKVWVKSFHYDPGLYVTGTTEATTQLEQMTHQVYSVYLGNTFLPNVYEGAGNSAHLLTTRGFNYEGRVEDAVTLTDFTVFKNQIDIQIRESPVFAAQGGFAGLGFENSDYTLVLYIEAE